MTKKLIDISRKCILPNMIRITTLMMFGNMHFLLMPKNGSFKKKNVMELQVCMEFMNRQYHQLGQGYREGYRELHPYNRCDN